MRTRHLHYRWQAVQAARAPALRATTRVIVGGVLAMVITYGVGVLFGTAVG